MPRHDPHLIRTSHATGRELIGRVRHIPAHAAPGNPTPITLEDMSDQEGVGSVSNPEATLTHPSARDKEMSESLVCKARVVGEFAARVDEEAREQSSCATHEQHFVPSLLSLPLKSQPCRFTTPRAPIGPGTRQPSASGLKRAVTLTNTITDGPANRSNTITDRPINNFLRAVFDG